MPPAVSFDRWLSVESGLKLHSDPSNFAAYWGLWRKVDPNELGLVLVSRRRSQFITLDCQDNRELHGGFESDDVLDLLEPGPDGLVVPLREAPLPGHRYFSFLNLNGVHLRSPLPPPIVTRNPGESGDEFRARKTAAFVEWKEAQNPRGTYGRVSVDLDVYLVSGLSPEMRSPFKTLQERRDGSRDPDSWPFYFDERAHKPTVPSAEKALEAIIESGAAIHEGRLGFHLEWRWLDGPAPSFEYNDEGEIRPTSGPQRPGR